MTDKNKYLVVLGFILLQVLILVHVNRFDIEYNLFWFCNHVPILFAIGFLINNADFIKGLISVGFLGQLLWIIDFFSALIFDTFLFNITNYIFVGEVTFFTFIPIFAHLLSTVLAIYLTRREPIRNISLAYSLGYIIVLFIATRLFTPESLNINCAYEICLYTALTPPFYEVFWFILGFLIVILPTFYLQKVLYQQLFK